ncbi:MAG TPA: peptidylprolyl isomerase [Gemmatimonadales bacterium]
MRRLLVIVGALASAGCSNFRDAFSAHADTAAEAGTMTLTPERLGEILAGPKNVRLNSDAANLVTAMWVDYALFAQAVAEGKLPTDSASVAEALWPIIAEIREQRWHDSLVSRRAALTDADVDSIYGGNDVRVFQHILFPVAQTATPEERAAARREAERALEQVGRGTDFGQLAARLSKDPQSARDMGYLPASQRGQFVTSFDSAGWSLAPGQVSGIVETPFGVHLIKRPGVTEVRDRLRQAAQALAVRQLDSMYVDSLARSNELEVKSSAAATLRDAFEDLDRARASKKTVATWKGGELALGDVVRWVDQIPPQFQAQIRALPDSQLTTFTRTVAQNVLILRQADSAGITLTPLEWQGMQQQYQAEVDSLRAEMGLGSDVSDSTIPVEQRREMAAMKVQTYFDRLLAGQVRLRRLPATLGQVLRDNLSYDVHPAGVARGLEIAMAKQASDTTGAGAAQMPQLQPSPGPAPAPADPSAAPDSAAQRGQ